MFEKTIFQALVTDDNLDAQAVDDTGTDSEEIPLTASAGMGVEIAATFQAGPTENLVYEVYESLDGENFVENTARGGTITAVSLATIRKLLFFEPTVFSIYIKAKSSGATETPTVTLKTRRAVKLQTA